MNKIIQGECAQMMEGFSDEFIDLTVTSPPYDDMDENFNPLPGGLRDYEGYTWDFKAIAEQLWRVTKEGGVVVWVVGDATIDGSETGTSFRQALKFMDIGFRLYDTMIYRTDKPPMNDRRYQACFEYMFVFSKGKPATFNPIMVKSKYAGSKPGAYFRKKDGTMKKAFHNEPIKEKKIKESIWRFTSGYAKTTTDKFAYTHPAMFPEALARDHILSWSNPGDLVLDPFCGSGTTPKMCVQTDRNYIGIDISEEYCELARKRVKVAQPPLFT